MSESSQGIDYAAAARAADRETIRDRAAQWSDLLRHRGGHAEVRESFERWRAERPEHAEAFNRIDATHALARAARDTDAMAEIERDTLRRVAARRAGKRRKTFAIAASVVVAVIAGLAVTEPVRNELNYWGDWASYALAGDSLYRTEVGEQRAIELADGTELTLNTDSRAVVQYQEGTRGVTLLQGQALFEVAHDTTRPFVVTAGDRRITALGTAFDVRLTDKELEVVLIEGRVSIEESEPTIEQRPAPSAQRPASPAQPTAPTQHETILSPGEQFLLAAAARAPVIHEVDTRLATSWRDGQLIFRNERLAEAVEEVNRYSKRKIVLTDKSLGDLRVSGIVNTGNTAVFVETMTNYYPVKIVDQARNQVTLGPRRG